MKLSAELFQAIIQALRLSERDGSIDAGQSTLRVRRVRLGGTAIVIPCTGASAGRSIEAVARDVSPSGIALTLPVRMVRGDSFILQARRAGDLAGTPQHCSLLCTVARYQINGESLYTVGAVFTGVLMVPAA